MKTLSIPLHITRKNKKSKWYQDSVTGKWVHKDNLATYIENKQNKK